MQLAGEVRRSPLFPEAERKFTDSVVKFRLVGPRLVNKLLGKDARIRIVSLCHCLHERALKRGDDGWVAAAEIVDIIENTLGGSKQIVNTTLDMMVVMQLLSKETGRRQRHFFPTPRLVALLRSWYSAMAAHVDRVDPDGKRSERFEKDDGIFEQMAAYMGDAFVAGESLSGRVPELASFNRHDYGWAVLNVATVSAYDNTALPSIRSTATLFHIPKSQVAVILNDALQEGLLERRISPGVWPTRQLTDNYSKWVSISFAFWILASRK
jgi:hypothetical protein